MLETGKNNALKPRTDSDAPSTENELNISKREPRFRLRTKMAAAATGLSLVIGAGIGIGLSQNTDKAPPQAVETSEPLPTSEPTAIETPQPVQTPEVTVPVGPESYNFNVSTAEIQPFLDESPENFNARPVEERAMLALYYAQDFPKFSKEWMSVSGDSRDALPMTISVENTPEEIIAFTSTLVRFPYTITDTADNFSLDQETANKVLAAGRMKGAGSNLYPQFTTLTQQFIDSGQPATSARSFAASGHFPITQINSASEVFVNAQNQTCRTMNITDVVLGNSYTSDSEYCLITATNGQSIWMNSL